MHPYSPEDGTRIINPRNDHPSLDPTKPATSKPARQKNKPRSQQRLHLFLSHSIVGTVPFLTCRRPAHPSPIPAIRLFETCRPRCSRGQVATRPPSRLTARSSRGGTPRTRSTPVLDRRGERIHSCGQDSYGYLLTGLTCVGVNNGVV